MLLNDVVSRTCGKPNFTPGQRSDRPSIEIGNLEKCIGVAILCITVPMGLIAMCVGSIFSSLIGLGINTYYTGKIIQVGFLKQMRDLMPTLFYSPVDGAVVYATANIIPGERLQLIAGIAAGIAYFAIVTRLTKSQDLRELLAFIKERK